MNTRKHTGWKSLVSAAVVGLLGNPMPAQEPSGVKVVKEVNADAPGGLYVGHRPPLQPSALMKLPIGNITPRGWLRRQLET